MANVAPALVAPELGFVVFASCCALGVQGGAQQAVPHHNHHNNHVLVTGHMIGRPQAPQPCPGHGMCLNTKAGQHCSGCRCAACMVGRS